MRGRLFRRYLLRFLIWVGVFTVAYVGLGLAVYLVAHNRIWRYDDFWYPLAYYVNLYWIFVVTIGYVLGLFVIVLVQWRSIAVDSATLVAAIEQMATDRGAQLALPKGLGDVELALRKMQLEALHNEEAAREAEQRKNDLVVYLAHDLKTPLTSVLGYLTLLRDEADISPELRQKYLGIAATKAERLEDLINEFFEITRFNLKGLALEAGRLNFSRLLEQVNDEFRPLYAEKGLTHVASIQPDIEMLADAGKLERVIDNLLRNAVNYSHTGGEVHIQATSEGGQATLVVTNQGDTIPEHKLAHIFEQFYRLDASRSAQVGGAGLGLAIAKEIVELHGGSIEAASENEQVTFTLRLPLLPSS